MPTPMQTPGLFHNIGKINKQILVNLVTPGDKFANTGLQGDQIQTAHYNAFCAIVFTKA